MKLIRKQLIYLFTGSIILLSACGGKEEQPKQEKTPAVPVETAMAAASEANAVLASGQVESKHSVQISTRIMGTVTAVMVKLGDKVKKGQLLVRISSDDIQARRQQADAAIQQAQASLSNAQKDYERFTKLYQQQSASAKELDNVTLQYKSAKAQLDAAIQMRREAEASLGYAELRAPVAGVITQKWTETGNLANPGQPLLQIDDDADLRISADIAESDIGLLHQGQAATINVESAGQTFSGTIKEISRATGIPGGTYKIKLSLPAGLKGLYPGMYAHINIPLPASSAATQGGQAILVPLSSLYQKDQLKGIYTISSENTAVLRWIRTGKTYGNQIEVLSGLSANERYIARYEGKLFDGAPVEINQHP